MVGSPSDRRLVTELLPTCLSVVLPGACRPPCDTPVHSLLVKKLLLFFRLPVPLGLPRTFPFHCILVLLRIKQAGFFPLRGFTHLCGVLLHRELDEAVRTDLIRATEEPPVLILDTQVLLTQPSPHEVKKTCEAYKAEKVHYHCFLRIDLFSVVDAVKLLFHKPQRVKERIEEKSHGHNPSQSNCKRPKAFLIPIVYKPIKLPCSLI